MNPAKLEKEEIIILDKLYLAIRPFDIILLSFSFPNLAVHHKPSLKNTILKNKSKS